jgi:hypothetical protein
VTESRAGSGADAAAALRAVLVAIDTGEVDATENERAYLAGAVAALDAKPGV